MTAVTEPALKIMSMHKCRLIFVVRQNCHGMHNALFNVSVPVAEVAKVYNLMNLYVKCLIKLHKSTFLMIVRFDSSAT